MDLQRQRGPRDPYAFPGVSGGHIRVRTNLFDMKFDRRTSIAMFEVVGAQKTKEGSIVPVQSRKLFSLFKNNYANELQNYEVVEGYPTQHGVMVYTVPSYPHNLFPERQDHQNRFIKISAEFRGDVKTDEWNKYDNELRRFLKRAALQSIAQLFQNHGFTMMKKGIYTFETNRQHARFPKQPLNNIFELVSGFKIGFETNVPNPDGSSRNMVSLDLTQTVCTRTNIPLFECYLNLCTFPHQARRILRPGDLQGQLLDTTSVSLLNRVLANIEVYIYGEQQRGGRNVLYKFEEICNQPSTHFTLRDRTPIVRHFEERLRIRLEFPTLNAVKIKQGIKNIKHVPLELICLSDRPQRVAVAALNILTELNQRVKELAAVVPGPRWEFIEGIAGRLQAELMDSNERNLLKSIGIQINDKPIEVDARVLDVPLDTYSESPGTLAMPFRNPVDYVIIDLRRFIPNRNDSIEEDVDTLMEKLYNLGIYISGKRCKEIFKYDPRHAADELTKIFEWNKNVCFAEKKIKLLYIVVIDDEPDKDVYQAIKQKLDCYGIINQVIKIGVLRNVKVSYRRDFHETSEDYTYNIALNINAKLGGINCTPSHDVLNLWNEDVNSDELVMFMGIDTRLSTQKNKLGIVGVTTSIDNKGTRYNAFAVMTNGVQKYCSDYKNILYHAFDAYKGADGRPSFPTKIIIFRAGMNEYDLLEGEGILEKSHIDNIIRKYMDEYGLQCKPLITYIGYHRSHGVRFYDQSQENRIRELKSDTDLEGVKLNVPPGTIIDSCITNPNCFYFVSHETFMGTTKPSKYTIVFDEIRFKADNMLAIVYQLCRLMPQTKRSFRKPAPIGLAGKLLERCVTVHPTLFDDLDKEDPFYINPDIVNRPFYI